MDQRIFDQLDMLERGARFETRPTRDEHHNSIADYSAYEGHNAGYGDEYQQANDEFVDQPMVLDSFGEQALTSYASMRS